jgi:precorrin-6Y C5,15-methyltransferase (decarboxylating)
VPEGRIAVVGMGDGVSAGAVEAAREADLVVGAERHLRGLSVPGVVLDGDLPGVLQTIEDQPGRVCVLASGDPGFFGIVRVLADRFGPDALDVRPAPSAVSMAFARLGLPWDDAVVVSAHGRPLADAARRAAAAPKSAVLTSPDAPPQALARELLQLGAERQAAVCSRLGERDEVVARVDLPGMAAQAWDPCSVVVLLMPHADPLPAQKTLAWGRPEDEFAYRCGMVTKAEVRAVVIGKLAVPPAGVLWDVGAGSGSIGIECAALAPALRVLAVERDRESCERILENAGRHRVAVEVVAGEATAALSTLPDPDRAVVGGGGLDVLDAVLARLRPGGRVVATYAALDRAAAAYDRLGQLCQVSISRADRLPDGGVRLTAANPVFVAWGPDR